MEEKFLCFSNGISPTPESEMTKFQGQSRSIWFKMFYPKAIQNKSIAKGTRVLNYTKLDPSCDFKLAWMLTKCAPTKLYTFLKNLDGN